MTRRFYLLEGGEKLHMLGEAVAIRLAGYAEMQLPSLPCAVEAKRTIPFHG
jgi:hypothetical protein